MRENNNTGLRGVRTDDHITDKLYTGHYDTTYWWYIYNQVNCWLNRSHPDSLTAAGKLGNTQFHWLIYPECLISCKKLFLESVFSYILPPCMLINQASLPNLFLRLKHIKVTSIIETAMFNILSTQLVSVVLHSFHDYSPAFLISALCHINYTSLTIWPEKH